MHENIEVVQVKSQSAIGKSFASFGEVIQGRKSDGVDFLVTLPIDLWSRCKLKINEQEGAVAVISPWEKSKKAVQYALSYFGIHSGYRIEICFDRNIPIGKGLSSSTADMLATLRALQKALKLPLSNQAISTIFNQIEPHDGVMYNNSVVYNHRNGQLLRNLDYIPNFKLLVLDFGGCVDSVAYNHQLKFTAEVTQKYNRLYQKCINAYLAKSDRQIAKCATKSLKIDLKNNPDPLRSEVLETYKEFGAMGIVNTHSGTCVGLIYPSNFNHQVLLKIKQELESKYDAQTYLIQTLPVEEGSGLN